MGRKITSRVLPDATTASLGLRDDSFTNAPVLKSFSAAANRVSNAIK
jgi:hypothetical protein